MSARVALRPGESLVVAVSPAAQGVLGPLLVALLVIGAVASADHLWVWPRAHVDELSVLGLPPLVVLTGRTLRWWRQRVVVTTERIVEAAGVLKRHRTEVEIGAIGALHVRQDRRDRLLRRGTVAVDLYDGTVELQRVRRPEVFVRVLNHVRAPSVPAVADEPTEGPVRESASADTTDWDVEDDAPLRWRHLFGDGGRHA